MAAEMEMALGVAAFTITAGSAIAGYTVQAVKVATAGVIASVNALATSVRELRQELVLLREEHNKVARIVAVLQDAHENGKGG